MKKVYICSPCRGDYENNIQRAKEYSRAAAMRGCIPVTPHIYLTQFMDDAVPAERELALSFGRELVLMCDEVWAFGLDHPSAGMAAEIAVANDAGIRVVNGFEAISRIGQPEADDEELPDVGSVTINLPGFKTMAVDNIHFNRLPLSVELDGNIILDLAAKLRANPGQSFEIGGGRRDE